MVRIHRQAYNKTRGLFTNYLAFSNKPYLLVEDWTSCLLLFFYYIKKKVRARLVNLFSEKKNPSAGIGRQDKFKLC